MGRPLRLIHTSDWHLGHRLYNHGRDAEHARFLAFLLDLIVAEDADALIVAGDVFDSANPPAEAQRAYYEFLAACVRRKRDLNLIVLGGNHDSPARLDAPAEVLRPLNIHVLGGLGVRWTGEPPEITEAGAGDGDGAAGLDVERALVPLKRGDEILAWLVAIPFLRPTDLPSAFLLGLDEAAAAEALATDELRLRAVRFVHDRLFAAARQRRAPGQALLAAGHCFLVGGTASESSERLIQIGKVGKQAPWPHDVFPSDVAYVALGHLHKGQRVGGQEHVRYAGSPIPLALSERTYTHQVLVVDLDGESLQQVRPVAVPRTAPILAIPDEARPLAEVLPLLAALPRVTDENRARLDVDSPFLDVRVRRGPEPGVKQQVEAAVRDAFARFCRVELEPRGSEDPTWIGEGSDDGDDAQELRELQPEEVFAQCYRKRAASAAPEPGASPEPAPVPPALQQRFSRLVEAVHSGADAGAVLGAAWRGTIEGPT